MVMVRTSPATLPRIYGIGSCPGVYSRGMWALTSSGVILSGATRTLRHLCRTHGFHVACVVLLCQVGKRRLVRPFGQVWVDFFEVPPTTTTFDYFLLLVTLQCITSRCVEVCLRCCATTHRKVMMIGRQVSGESLYGSGVWSRCGGGKSRSCVLSSPVQRDTSLILVPRVASLK